MSLSRWFSRRARERDRAEEVRAHLDVLCRRAHRTRPHSRGGPARSAAGVRQPARSARGDSAHEPSADGRCPRPRRALRAPRAAPDTGVHDHVRRHARARDRRLHGRLQPGRRDSAPAAAVSEPERLALVERTTTAPSGGRDRQRWTAPRGKRCAITSTSLDRRGLSAARDGANLVVGDAAAFVRQHRVGAGFFRVLGVRSGPRPRVQPRLRIVAGGPAVTVLSDDLWRRVFQGRSGDRRQGDSVAWRAVRRDRRDAGGIQEPHRRRSVDAASWLEHRRGQRHELPGRCPAEERARRGTQARSGAGRGLRSRGVPAAAEARRRVTFDRSA